MNDNWQKPESGLGPTLAAAPITDDKLKGARILVIDDHAFMRNLVERMLMDIGVGEIHLTPGAEQALDIVKQGIVSLDLVVCDLRMPNQDGLAFVEALRKLPDPVSARLPVLILTGDATAANIEAAVRLGIQGFVAKPVTAVALRDHIVRALAAPAMGRRDEFAGQARNVASDAFPAP